MTAQPLSSLQPPACLADDICTTISTLLRSQVGRRSQHVPHGALELLESSLHRLTAPDRQTHAEGTRGFPHGVFCGHRGFSETALAACRAERVAMVTPPAQGMFAWI